MLVAGLICHQLPQYFDISIGHQVGATNPLETVAKFTLAEFMEERVKFLYMSFNFILLFSLSTI